MKKLKTESQYALLEILKVRFDAHAKRFPNLDWSNVEAKLLKSPEKLWTLNEMERTGGEPNLLEYDKDADAFTFCDFSKESPKDRRSLCYDKKAWEFRKKFKPADNVKDVASRMGIDLMNETQYRKLQSFGDFDTKTSSWLETPASIRKLGGAIFADFRYGQVFIYHNGAESYYGSRGFRGVVRV
ncbi:DUF4256 domain-containing protein [Aequorivita sp. H23M31]|uniref:DUF4256 domain-containing protein n=1 Tax=Aequorivita ciconiae TaxID=2494375 RepID=A0A410G647_9FLAO|nr:DUF4256 domain-containing protein [Aequorivita sp. H23M31]QAA82701.1 DUF4256 domain-containing protein [Aequorivita sp. H23M31]